MKQIIFSILIFACLSPLQGQNVSENTARQVAATYFHAKMGKTAPQVATVPAPAMHGGTPAYYVCTPDDGKGFVIVAGTKGSIPILAYSTEGSFSLDNMPPAVEYWMNGYKAQLDEIVEKHLKPTAVMAEKWKALENGSYAATEGGPIGPLLKTTWSQGQYYNNNCPSSSNGTKAQTGCVATAMAQIIKYWNFPVSGSTYVVDEDNNASNGISGTFDAWVGGEYFHWNNMPNALVASTPQNQKDEVAWLMYSCGVAVKMNYGTYEYGGSGASMDDAQDALANIFGYESCYMSSRGGNFLFLLNLQNELSLNKPVLYYGTDNTKTPAKAHAWVCDGFDGEKYHMNWGWGGSSDGYYFLDNLNPDQTDKYYNSDQGAILGILPAGCTPFYEGNLPTTGLGSPLPLEVANYIHITGGTVTNGFTSIMNAGTEIVLLPGFSVQSGSVGRFYIEGCDGQFVSPNGDRSEKETPAVETKAAEVDIFPNPFSASTTIAYTLPADQQVDIQIFNTIGELVAQPVKSELQTSGLHEYAFEAADLPTGIYFLVMHTGGQKQTKRLVVTH